MRAFVLLFTFALAALNSIHARGQSAPEALVSGIRIQPRTMVGGGAVRIDHRSGCGLLARSRSQQAYSALRAVAYVP